MAGRGLFVMLLGLGGCLAEAPPPPQPPLPLARQIRQEALHEAPPPDIRVAERSFAEAVEDFAIGVRLLETSVEPPSESTVAHALGQFACALEATPGGEIVNTHEKAAEMRETSPGAALRIGVDALLALARRPYGKSLNVERRAAELRVAFDPAATYTPEELRARLPEALRRAVFLMKAILEMRDYPRGR